MTRLGHLWAVGYDDIGRANQLRDEIMSLDRDQHSLVLADVAVVERHPDGSFMIDRESLPAGPNILGCSLVGLLAGLVVGAPLTGAALGAVVGGAGSSLSALFGIGDDFIEEVKALMKPGTSAVFVLEDPGDMDVILHKIRGLGGTVLKTNVDLERARLIQSTLAAASEQRKES